MPSPSDPAPNFVEPESIGPYRIVRALGRGGMGVVYHAEHRETGEPCALKTVRLADQAMLSSIRREIHALRRLVHPGVVRIVAEGIDDGLPWYAMDLLRGRTLHDHNALQWRDGNTLGVTTTMAAPTDAATAELPPSGPLSSDAPRAVVETAPVSSVPRAPGRTLAETLGLLRGVCDTLAFVHGMGLVHRDLKPDNVFIRDDGTPVLVDFGLALAASGATGRDVLAVSGRPMGSPAYMAPEQIRGELVDARADLYALGCMLYESVTGRVPFEGTVQMVISQHLYKQPAPPSQIVAGVPAALEQLILTLLQKRPQERIGYADDVAVALAALGAEGPEGWRRGQPYLYRPGLAGRSDKLADVVTALGRAQQQKGARIFVGGESGVGKTRFAMEISQLATRRGLRVVAGECAAVSAGEDRDAVRAAPLHPFRPLLLSIADRCREMGAEETARLLGDRGPVLGAYEPSILRLPGQDQQPELAPLQAQAARARLVSALTETLSAFGASEPLLLLIDDLQWADENSLAVLEALDEAWLDRSPVVLLGTYRTEEASDAVRALTRAEGALSIELGRLDAAAVGQMVSDMLAMPAPPSAFIDFLVEQSEGNPFFIAEYLRVAIEERVLARNERGEWRVANESMRSSFREALPLPRELYALVGRRVAALGTGARALSRVAAVLGREFDADVLAAATTLDEIPGLEAIEELRARQILDVVGGRLRFAHDKLREIIYADIPAEQSRALSGVAARAIEARYGNTPEIAGYYPILAHHFATAGDDAKAIEYLEKAGHRALETGASAEALGFFRRALELDEQRRARGDEPADMLRRASWERRLGQAEFNLGHMREAERLTRGALHRLRKGRAPDEGSKPSAVIGLVVLVAHLLRQFYHLFGPARRASADPAERRRLTEASLAAERLSEIYFFQSEPLLSFSAALQSANLAEELGPSPELARSYATLSVAFGLVPWQRVVDAYEARARAAADTTGDPEAISWVYFLVGLSAIGTGRWDDARAALSHSREIARAVQDHRRVEECLALVGNVDMMTGHIDDAERHYSELWDSARRSGNRQGEVWSLHGRSECCVVRGRIDEAHDLMERAHQLKRPDSSDESERVSGGEAALVHLMRDDHTRARRVAEGTLELMVRLSPSAFHLVYGYVATCEVFLALYEAERAPDLARQAHAACRAMRGYARIFPIGRPYAHRFKGLRAAIDGDLARAERSLLRSIAEAEQLGMPLEAGLAHYDLGRFLPDTDPRKAEHLARAREAFERLDARFQLARVVAVIEGATTPELAA
ncbi:serine/threonine protein kinase [Minicystis rosea]|nr:serine/threonine protein kinase [Minicystis rosea]